MKIIFQESGLRSFFSLFILISGLSLSACLTAEEFDASAKYAKTCGVCHTSGVAGAPRKGDAKAWEQRLAKGEKALLSSVVNGMGAMPAKGLCGDCSDAQLSELINFMSK